eukprot:5855324-Amphidinium_carterae.1
MPLVGSRLGYRYTKAYQDQGIMAGKRFWHLFTLVPVTLATLPFCPHDVPCCVDTPTEIEEVKDIKYGEANFNSGRQELLFDLYRPLSMSPPHAVVVNVHGGSFSPESSKSDPWIVAESRRWARRGFLVAAIEYRRHGGTGEANILIDPVHDTLAAVRHLVNNSAVYGIDVHNIALYGCSAGGLTVAHTNILDLGDGSSGTPGVDSNVSVTFSLSGGIYADLLVLAQPKETENIAPYIAVHNKEDPLVEYSFATATATLLDSLDIENKLITLEGDGHCQDPVSLAGESNANLFDDIVGFMLLHMTVPHCRVTPVSMNSTSTSTSISDDGPISTTMADDDSTSITTPDDSPASTSMSTRTSGGMEETTDDAYAAPLVASSQNEIPSRVALAICWLGALLYVPRAC